MSTRVDASTSNAGQLFSNTYFSIPNFQRDYSWTVEEEVSDFWRDLSDALDSAPYFLGLLIVTDSTDADRKMIVDGQQRVTTLTLLANALRRIAVSQDKNLVAENMRDTFLYGLDYDTEERAARVRPTSQRDRRTLEHLLDDREVVEDPARFNPLLVSAQRFLDKQLRENILEGDAALRIGKWARFLTNGLTFAIFDHPNKNSAYKVYEVVNTRGKDLTPAELIKGYIFGAVSESREAAVAAKWASLEKPFLDLGLDNQFTQFVRHVVTLEHGYVIPRDLYQQINEWYPLEPDVLAFLELLSEHLETYLQLIDPSRDTEIDEELGQAFAILDAMGLRTVRPAFLAMARARDRTAGLESLLRIVLPRLVVGSFGTGSIERQFAEAAKNIYQSGSWTSALDDIKHLRPTRTEFATQVRERPFSKGLILVVRNSFLQGKVLPALHGFPHQVRPRNAEQWESFPDDDFKDVGATIGNYVLVERERRPRNTNTALAVSERLVAELIPEEYLDADAAASWSAQNVRAENERIAAQLEAVWYAE